MHLFMAYGYYKLFHGIREQKYVSFPVVLQYIAIERRRAQLKENN